jgi:hypothetical protein
MTDRAIQIFVARADLILCTVLRWAVIVALLAAVLVVAVIIVRARLPDSDLIDYDAPGVDITSEGPDGRTRAWYEIEGDDTK